MSFVVCIFGLFSKKCLPVPAHIQKELELATTPLEIEQIISEHETEFAQLFCNWNDFLVCDQAAELMADVLRSKGIPHKIICGVNDIGDSHSYVEVDGKFYDPTHQGFGCG